MKMSTKVGTAVVLVAIVAYGGLAALSQRSRAETTTPVRQARDTARLERRDLIETEDFQGSLVFDGARTLSSPAAGTVLAIAREGSIARRGEPLFKVEGETTRLLYGAAPVWRDFSYGMDDGRDVAQLERNLVAMGYDPYGWIDVDRDFDTATSAAIERWEDDLNVEQDGVLRAGEVVFARGPVRIGAHDAERGARVGPGARLLTVSSTRQVVEIDLPANKRALARVGKKVTVDVPAGPDVSGRVSSVGAVVEPPAEQGGDPTITVEIRLGSRVRAFEEAPVEVTIESSRARDVLAAPVAALLALAEGGYAVEVVRGESTELVAVGLGAYADGWVEITAEGLEEGTEVVVAG